MKYSRVAHSHHIKEELFDDEIALINQAINARRSHIRSVDELDRRNIAPRPRKSCTTNKRKFKDKQQADRILHFIMNNRKDALATGENYRFKQFRSYRCGCGYFHHSSKPEISDLQVCNVA